MFCCSFFVFDGWSKILKKGSFFGVKWQSLEYWMNFYKENMWKNSGIKLLRLQWPIGCTRGENDTNKKGPKITMFLHMNGNNVYTHSWNALFTRCSFVNVELWMISLFFILYSLSVYLKPSDWTHQEAKCIEYCHCEFNSEIKFVFEISSIDTFSLGWKLIWK